MPDPILSQEEIDALLKQSPPAGEAGGLNLDALGDLWCVVSLSALGALVPSPPQLSVRRVELKPAEQLALEVPDEGRSLVSLSSKGRILGSSALWLDKSVTDEITSSGEHPPALAEVALEMGQLFAQALGDVLGGDMEMTGELSEGEALLPEALAREEQLVVITLGGEQPLVELALPIDVAGDLIEALQGEASRTQAEAEAQAEAQADLAAPPIEAQEAEELVAASAEMEAETEAEVAQPARTPAVQPPIQAPGGGGVADRNAPNVRPATFSTFAASAAEPNDQNLNLIMDVPVEVTVELGRTHMEIREVLQLGKGSVFELEKLAGEPVDVYVNGKRIARGETVVMDDENFGVRITEIVNPFERVNNIQ